MSIKTSTELKAYFETGDIPTQAQFIDLVDTIMDGLSARPKIYKALISQTGADAPTVVELINTIGNVVWSRTGNGTYLATLAGAFTLGKTFPKRGDNYSGFSNVGFWISDVNTCYLSSQNNNGTNAGGVYSDSLIDQMPIQIEVYP